MRDWIDISWWLPCRVHEMNSACVRISYQIQTGCIYVINHIVSALRYRNKSLETLLVF